MDEKKAPGVRGRVRGGKNEERGMRTGKLEQILTTPKDLSSPEMVG